MMFLPYDTAQARRLQDDKEHERARFIGGFTVFLRQNMVGRVG